MFCLLTYLFVQLCEIAAWLASGERRGCPPAAASEEEGPLVAQGGPWVAAAVRTRAQDGLEAHVSRRRSHTVEWQKTFLSKALTRKLEFCTKLCLVNMYAFAFTKTSLSAMLCWIQSALNNEKNQINLYFSLLRRQRELPPVEPRELLPDLLVPDRDGREQALLLLLLLLHELLLLL